MNNPELSGFSQEDREWLAKQLETFGERLPTSHQAITDTIITEDITPDVQVRDISHLLTLPGQQDKYLELISGHTAFEMYLGSGYVQLKWEGTNTIPFTIESLHKTALGEIAELCGNMPPIDLEDYLPVRATIHSKKEKKQSIRLNLDDETDYDDYLNMMSKPDAITNISYQVFNQSNNHVYTFEIENKPNVWDKPSIRIGLVRQMTWNEGLLRWAIEHHKNGEYSDSFTPSALTQQINALVSSN